MRCTQLLFRKTKGYFEVILESHSPNLFEPVHPLCLSVPEQDAESLPAYRATDPDLCLLWMRANEKTNSSHASIRPAGGAFDWTVPLSLEAATCLDGPAARCFCPACALVVGVQQNKSGTCLLRQHHHLSSHNKGTRQPLGTAPRVRKTAAQIWGWRRGHNCRFNFGLNRVLCQSCSQNS